MKHTELTEIQLMNEWSKSLGQQRIPTSFGHSRNISEALISQMFRYVMAVWAHGSPLLQKFNKSKRRGYIRELQQLMGFSILEKLVVI